MKINDTLYGFKVKNIENAEDAHGTLYTMEHEKTGAPLTFLQRDDSNMTFSIAFRTPPKDDTGVFHIIEHSVLCGSRKYPVKDPFVELLKGSLNTFLNALTYEDRTVYPVSSRCEKDFLNLTDIYLDAVFHPRMLSDERIFLQEGWHYEYDENKDTLSYNGVVYNEMRGAYSSPEEIASNALHSALFPTTVYRHDSGGDPDAIPTLTYGELLRAHSTYYHPSNSMIFLDGSVDLDKLLPLIASYLDEYDRLDISVIYPEEPATDGGCTEVEFEPGSDPLARVLFGYVYSSPENKATDYALAILDNTIASTNDTALKRAMLDSGLCEDMATYVYRSRQTQYTVELIGVKEEDIPKVAEALEGAIRDIAKAGIDKERLAATLNNDELRMKEGDDGSYPRGVSNALVAYSFQNYGFPVSKALSYSDDIEFARASLDGDFYEQLLLSATVDNPHRACVVMRPKEGLGEKQAEALRERLSNIKSSLPVEELEKIKACALSLKEFQDTPDTPEAIATLPRLALSDIEPRPSKVKTQKEVADGATVLCHGIETRGITYLTLAFEANDLTDSELQKLSFAASLFKNLNTAEHSVSSLQNEIKSKLGYLNFSLTQFPFCDGSGRARVALSVTANALERCAHEIVKLAREVLLTTDFSDTAQIERRLIQRRSVMDEALTSDSLSFALARVNSSLSESGRISELTSGYTAYKWINEITKNTKETAKALSEELPELISRIAVKERLTVSLASEKDEALISAILSAFPSGKPSPEPKSFSGEPLRHGIPIPAKVSYAVTGAISEECCKNNGAMRVARSILNYEYLWGEVRVKGGAYGTGFITRKTGEMMFYSYRDPSPEAALSVYERAPAFLRELARDNCDLTKFIIGAYGDYDILSTPRTEASQALYDYMTGWSAEKELALKEGILSANGESLRLAADIIESAFVRSSTCVIGEKAAIGRVAPPLTELKTKF